MLLSFFPVYLVLSFFLSSKTINYFSESVRPFGRWNGLSIELVWSSRNEKVENGFFPDRNSRSVSLNFAAMLSSSQGSILSSSSSMCAANKLDLIISFSLVESTSDANSDVPLKSVLGFTVSPSAFAEELSWLEMFCCRERESVEMTDVFLVSMISFYEELEEGFLLPFFFHRAPFLSGMALHMLPKWVQLKYLSLPPKEWKQISILKYVYDK